jgi:hypothetical protein
MPIGDKTVAKTEAWYYGQRAESLALMYLTRRNDLSVSRQEMHYGLDFLVTICKDRIYSGRIFGVEVKASLSALKSNKGIITLPIRLTKHEASLYKDFPFPICLFFFAMENDKGYYRWIKEPVIEPKEQPKLVLSEGNELKTLTNEELDKIISRINKWYNKREAIQPTA